MKKVICSIVFLMSVSLVAFSQNDGKRAPKGNKRDFAKELNLSAEQKTKVKELNDTYKVKMDELKKNTSITKEECRKQMRELADQKKAEMKNILTEDQFAKMEARKDRRGDMKRTPKHGGAKFHNPRMMRGDSCVFGMPYGQMQCFKNLDLTDDQKAKIKDLNAKYAKKTKELRDDRRKEFENVLTADQKVKWEQFRKDRPKFDRKRVDCPLANGMNKGCCAIGKIELPQDVKAKLDALDENFKKEKQTIRNTRITVEMQDKRIEELRKKYREEKRELLKDVCPLNSKK